MSAELEAKVARLEADLAAEKRLHSKGIAEREAALEALRRYYHEDVGRLRGALLFARKTLLHYDMGGLQPALSQIDAALSPFQQPRSTSTPAAR